VKRTSRSGLALSANDPLQTCACPLQQPNTQSRVRPMDDANYYAAYLRRLGVPYFGILLVILAGLFGAFYVSGVRKIAYVKSHPPVTATITSKKEMRGKSPYTQVKVDYWREASQGPVHCLVSKNLPGWSSDYDVGNTIEVFPREEACSEPYVVLPDDDPRILAVCAFSLALIGVVMIGYGSLSVRRS